MNMTLLYSILRGAFFIFIFNILEMRNVYKILMVYEREIKGGKFTMGKMNKTKEDKFKDSLKSWGENDNRPFIREREDKMRDTVDYTRKHNKLTAQRMEVAAITGDRLEDIHIWSSSGLETQMGNIKDWTPIKEEE